MTGDRKNNQSLKRESLRGGGAPCESRQRVISYARLNREESKSDDGALPIFQTHARSGVSTKQWLVYVNRNSDDWLRSREIYRLRWMPRRRAMEH
jgi:hypothetical protein